MQKNGTIEVHYFAAARAAAGVAHELIDAPATLAELMEQLASAHTGTTDAGMNLGEIFPRCSFLIDGTTSTGDPAEVRLDGVRRVDVLPPFAGG